jgi:hypothetical protein
MGFAQQSESVELHAPVWFRTSCDAEWRTGISSCVSTTRAVVQSDDLPSLFDEVVVVIGLSATGCLVGRGRVFRAQPSSGPNHPANFAIRVDHYDLEHRETILSSS